MPQCGNTSVKVPVSLMPLVSSEVSQTTDDQQASFVRAMFIGECSGAGYCLHLAPATQWECSICSTCSNAVTVWTGCCALACLLSAPHA